MSIISKSEQLTVFAAPKPYALLEPRKLEPRTGEYHGLIVPVSDIQLIHEMLQTAHDRGDVIAIDIETRGTDPQLPDSEIVGIGFAGSDFSVYIDRTADRAAVDELIRRFPEWSGIRWIAHNISFDGLWFYHVLGQHISWHVCTYALYRHLATEGWLGQQWGLKAAMTELLLWENTNEDGIDNWLKSNGYVNQSGNPQKGEMWRVPADILGSYCILDSEATWLLYNYILSPVYNKFPALVEYHSTHFMKLIEVLIQQRLTGILVDRPLLGEAYNEIADYLDKTLEDLRTHPEVAKHITEWENAKKQEVWAAQPEQYLRKKKRTEPQRYKKDGSQSKNWEKWRDLEAQPPVVSKNWEKWEAKWKLTEAGLNEDCQFNFRSGDHLRWLFYDRLQHPVTKTTETGLPVVDVDTVGRFGETGKLLESYLLNQKEMGFVEAYLELTENRPTIHAGFKTPGTLTGRLSGTAPNLQQLPKSRRFLQTLVARPGHVWIDADFCLHPDTEYLTRRGWIPVLEIKETDEVWQVDSQTLKGSWTLPIRVIKKEYNGSMYSFGNRRGRLQVTENHTMLWSNQTTRNRPRSSKITKSQQGVPSAYHSQLLTSTSSDIRGYCPTYTELNFVCMLQADSYYDGSKYHLQLALPRKREEARHLLRRDGYVTPPRGGQNLEVETWRDITYSSPLLKGKSLFLEELDTVNAEALVSCLSSWDGNIGRSGEIYYYSTDYTSIDQVQRYLVRCGYECRLGGHQPKYPGAKYLHKLTIRKAKGIRVRKEDIQQVTYSGMVGCVTVETGFILVRSGGQTFITGNCALEPVVCTELTGDPALMQVYGPDAEPGADIYLHTGAGIPALAKRIREEGYIPGQLTKEAVAHVKKVCKQERAICKVVYLSSQYGAGPKKIHETLNMQGVKISEAAVREIHYQYWELYKGIKLWEAQLLDQWRVNNGWILNGIGRPIGIHPDYRKDIVNRCLTGDTLVRVKDAGYKQLDMCGAHDLIWDGIEWVTCSGLLNQGRKHVIQLNGVELTSDHKVWNKYGNWKEAGNTRVEEIQQVSRPLASWKEVWGLCNLLGHQVAKAVWQGCKNICRRKM